LENDRICCMMVTNKVTKAGEHRGGTMAREAKKLKKSTLDSLRKKAQADPDFSAYVADAGQPGLYAWARRGRVRFVFAYRPPGGGRRRREKIDDYGAITLDQAREIARERRGIVAKGDDPKEIRERQAQEALTLGEAVHLYLDDFLQRAETGAKRGRRSGYSQAKRYLERHVVPKLGNVRIRKVSAQQVSRLHRSLKDTPVEANRMLTTLSAVFGYIDRVQPGTPLDNPCRHVEKFAENGQREALTLEQLRSLGEAMRDAEKSGSVHPSALLAIRLIALTGMRRSEVLGHESRARRGELEGLRWGDVHLGAGTIALRDSKTGAQTRVIGESVVDLLRAALPENADPDDPVCPGKDGSRPFVGIDRPRIKLFEAAGLANIPGIDLHSLRHTFASVGAHVQNGRYAVFVAPLLGHGYQKRSITERYIHSNLEALRPAADAISGALATSLGLAESARVIAFKA
jgi:integrase